MAQYAKIFIYVNYYNVVTFFNKFHFECDTVIKNSCFDRCKEKFTIQQASGYTVK